MERVLLAIEARNYEKEKKPWPRVGRNQCAYCKEEGHWARECPKNKNKKDMAAGLGKHTPILTTMEKDSD